MPTSPTNRLIDHLLRGVLPGDGEGWGDGELLARFVERHDEAALAALVRRHGPMVWGVCLRALRNHHDAEDAFQATFLVLVKKAASVVPRERVGNWLYGVAHQATLQAKRVIARRQAREVQVTDMPDTPAAQPDLSPDLQSALDEEVIRLPDIYRAVVVLCDLEGRTRKEVARQLGVPDGTVAGRLARARAMLARRLAQRGVTLSVGVLTAVLARNMASVAAPNSVVSSTIRAATLAAAGQTAATGAISVKVAALTDGVLKTMLISKLKLTVAVMMVLGFMAAGATSLFQVTATAQVGRVEEALKPQLKPEPERRVDAKELTAVHRFTVPLNKVEPWPKVPGCAFLDNDRILVQAATSVLEIRDATTGKLLQSVGLEKHSVGEFRLTPDRKSVAAVTIVDTTGTFLIPSPDVTVWDTTTWKVRGTISGHRLLDLAADGRTVLVREDDGWGERSGRVAVWDIVANKKLKVSPFEFRRFDAAAFSPDGSLIAVSGENEIAYWKWRDGDKYDRLKVGRKVDALVFSPDGKLVAEGPDSRMTVEIRDVATLKVVQALADPGQPRVPFMASGMAFADAGKTLALGNGIGLIETIPVPHRIHFWDVKTGKVIQKIALKGGMPYSLDVSPDGKTLAAVTADGGVSLRVFDLGRRNGAPVPKLDEPGELTQDAKTKTITVPATIEKVDARAYALTARSHIFQHAGKPLSGQAPDDKFNRTVRILGHPTVDGTGRDIIVSPTRMDDLSISASAKIKAGDKDIQLTDLKAGDHVNLELTMSEGGLVVVSIEKVEADVEEKASKKAEATEGKPTTDVKTTTITFPAAIEKVDAGAHVMTARSRIFQQAGKSIAGKAPTGSDFIVSLTRMEGLSISASVKIKARSKAIQLADLKAGDHVNLELTVSEGGLVVVGIERVAQPSAAEKHGQHEGAWDLRPPTKEPKYQKEPRYALLVFGAKREQRVWMVLDGTTLYVDRNGNGDLTEPGERLEPNNPKDGSNRFGGSGSHTHFDIFEFTVPAGAAGTSKFQLHHWIRAENFTPQTDFDKQLHARWLKLRWENSTLWRKEGQGQGQTPLYFMPKPADAQVCALDGPLTFVVRLPEHQVLKRGAAANDVAFCIAVKGRPPRGAERAFHNPLATREVPENAHLEVEIEYPAKTANAVPLRRKHLLKQRC